MTSSIIFFRLNLRVAYHISFRKNFFASEKFIIMKYCWLLASIACHKSLTNLIATIQRTTFIFHFRRLKNKSEGVAIPTHFYKMLMKCNTPSQMTVDKCMDNLDVLLLVLPHNKENRCKVGIFVSK